MFELGNSLHEARARRGVDLAQAEAATKVRSKYLRALEEERFDLLPAETYVKGFLRTYADYLGLDGQLYVDEYNSRFVAGGEWEPRRSPRSRRSGDRHHEERRLQANVVLLALAAVATLTVVVIAAWKTSSGGAPAAGRKPSPPPAHPRATSSAAPYLEVSAVRGPSKVIVHRGGAAGSILFEGTLDRGETQGFDGRRFWLNVGAPENLAISVAGRRVHVVGYQPWVLTVTPSGWHGHPA